jgi:serine/threonine protein kinase
MSARSKYTPVNQAAQGIGGNCNMGIVVVRHNRNGYTYIEKRVYPDSVDRGFVGAEIRAMQRCNGHPNIVAVAEYDLEYRRTGYGSIYMQHAELGSLDALIGRFAERRRGLEDEGFAWKILWNLSIALATLQTGQSARAVRERGTNNQHISAVPGWDPICHRDIKPSNVFLTWHNQSGDWPQYPTVLLGDFGCACTASQVWSGRGDPSMLPGNDDMFSALEWPDFTDKSEVYSLGLVLLCLANRSQEPPEFTAAAMAGSSEPMKWVVGKCLMVSQRDRVSPQDLPALVWSCYQSWLRGRRDYGEALPAWAFG